MCWQHQTARVDVLTFGTVTAVPWVLVPAETGMALGNARRILVHIDNTKAHAWLVHNLVLRCVLQMYSRSKGLQDCFVSDSYADHNGGVRTNAYPLPGAGLSVEGVTLHGTGI